MAGIHTNTNTRTRTTLLLIDAQKDFHPGGSLAIPTANDDAARIAALLKNHPTEITRVVATMDSHLKLHIAHPGFWISGDSDSDNDSNKEKKHPDIFTIISHQDVVDGKWKARSDVVANADLLLDPSVFEGAANVTTTSTSTSTSTSTNTSAEMGQQVQVRAVDLQKYALEYTKRLESKTNSKFKLCIWPEHCLIGSPGHALVDDIRTALDDWSETTGRSIEFVMKGENILTESYSAMEAEVPVTKDTQFNEALLESLVQSSDKLLVCGQAMSHCVNFTLRNLTERWPKERYGDITLLTDCASSVPGFEAAGDEFKKDMTELGVVLNTADKVFTSV